MTLHHAQPSPTTLAACGLVLLFMSCDASPPVLPRSPNTPTRTVRIKPTPPAPAPAPAPSPPAPVISNPDAILPGRAVYGIWALDMERIPTTPPIDPKLCFSDKAHTAPHTPSIQEITDQDHRFRYRVAYAYIAKDTRPHRCTDANALERSLIKAMERFNTRPFELYEEPITSLNRHITRAAWRVDPNAWIEVRVQLKGTSPSSNLGCLDRANRRDCRRCLLDLKQQRIRTVQAHTAVQIEELGGHVVRAYNTLWGMKIAVRPRDLKAIMGLDGVGRIDLVKGCAVQEKF